MKARFTCGLASGGSVINNKPGYRFEIGKGIMLKEAVT